MKKNQLIPAIFPRSLDWNLQPYAVGGLLYTPALHPHIAQRILERSIPFLQSLVLCLEDAIDDSAVQKAEAMLPQTFEILHRAVESGAFPLQELPFLFVRVRTPAQLSRIASHPVCRSLLTGFVLPKFSSQNMNAYFDAFSSIPPSASPSLRLMPTLESPDIASIFTRSDALQHIYQALQPFRRHILNIRVGGNDFCHLFHVRRHVEETIYDILPVHDILSDILNVFSSDYIVSGPVWEYFSTHSDDTLWQEGLWRELALDQLNGFVGKTAIHPAQLPVIRQAMQVSSGDYQDAQNILCWQNDRLLGVGKSTDGNRMNERNVHHNWASKIQNLAAVYGIQKNERGNPHGA